MRVALLTLLLGLTLAPWGHTAPPASTLMFSLSPENDGAQTLVSWNFSGPIKDSFAVLSGTWGGIGSMFDGAFNPSYFTNSSPLTFAISNAGIFNNLSTSTSVQVTEIEFGAAGPYRYMALMWGGAWFGDTGEQVSYTAGTDSYIINVPITAFNAGTYTATGGNVQGDMNFSATIVPEPSALSLLALGLGGLALTRLRRSL